MFVLWAQGKSFSRVRCSQKWELSVLSEWRPLTDFQEHDFIWPEGNVALVCALNSWKFIPREQLSLSLSPERWTCQIWGYPVAWLSPGCTHTERAVLNESGSCCMKGLGVHLKIRFSPFFLRRVCVWARWWRPGVQRRAPPTKYERYTKQPPLFVRRSRQLTAKRTFRFLTSRFLIHNGVDLPLASASVCVCTLFFFVAGWYIENS
jgi:hypothetical protein